MTAIVGRLIYLITIFFVKFIWSPGCFVAFGTSDGTIDGISDDCGSGVCDGFGVSGTFGKMVSTDDGFADGDGIIVTSGLFVGFPLASGLSIGDGSGVCDGFGVSGTFGEPVGNVVGDVVGSVTGKPVGNADGDGATVTSGVPVGVSVGFLLVSGLSIGDGSGVCDGFGVSGTVGDMSGALDGNAVGDVVGSVTGTPVGDTDGDGATVTSGEAVDVPAGSVAAGVPVGTVVGSCVFRSSALLISRVLPNCLPSLSSARTFSKHPHSEHFSAVIFNSAASYNTIVSSVCSCSLSICTAAPARFAFVST